MPLMPKRVPVLVENPAFVTFLAPDNSLITHVHRPTGWGPGHYGLAVCDLVRHIANALNCSEEAIWEWVEKERDNPTTEISRPS